MFNENNMKALKDIEDKGKLAEDLRIESYSLQNRLKGLEKGLAEIEKAYKVTCNNGSMNFNFDITNPRFAAEKIKEIIESEVELCKKNIKILNDKIENLVNSK